MDFNQLVSPIPSLEEIAHPLNAPVEDGPPDIINGFLPKHGQLLITGETDSGKSLIALETCSAFSTGQPLWGKLHPTFTAKRILYVLGEHYDGVISRLFQKTQLPMSDNVFLLGPEALKWDKYLLVGGKPNMVAAEKFKKWSEGCDLIVFDPLSSFLSGSGESGGENDSLTMRAAMDQMSLIAQSCGASSLILHHQGKPTIDQFGREHARKKYASRGSTAIEDAATNVFYLNKDENEKNRFELLKRKYKGSAPDSYQLVRSRETLTHAMADNNSHIEQKRLDARARIARLMAVKPDFTFRTAATVLSAVDGVPKETMFRWLGITADNGEV